MNYYISDLHINHNNILKFDNRPFRTVLEMNNALLHNWNNVIKNDDTVYILGDFIWDTEQNWPDIVKSFNGHKVLIRGNHDPKSFSNKTKNLFDDINDYKEITDNGKHVIMCHYPIPFYKSTYNPDMYMLYGHVHMTREYDFLKELRKEVIRTHSSNTEALGQFINVGCMLPYMNYTPRTLDEIVENEKDLLYN